MNCGELYANARVPKYEDVVRGATVGDWEYVLGVPGREYLACGSCGRESGLTMAQWAIASRVPCACGGTVVVVREFTTVEPSGVDPRLLDDVLGDDDA